MLTQIRKQLHECCLYMGRMVRVRGSFEIGFLNRVCDLLLSEDIVSQQQQEISTWGDNTNSNTNNITTANSPQYQSIKIDFVQLINQLLNIPPQSKSSTTTTQSKPITTSTTDNPTTNTNKLQFRQYQLLIIIDSLIFNLYCRSKKRDKLRLNNSFFNTSASVMSMSQMSDIMSQANHSVIANNINGDSDLRVALGYVQALVMNDVFYKRVKVFYQRQGGNKQLNHHYIENLLETLEYILNKEKLPGKQHLIKQRNMLFKSFMHSATAVTFVPNNNQQSLQTINLVLFTNQLDKILTLITSSQGNNNTQQQRVLFSINRVYFVAKRAQTRKHFRNIKYSAEDMLYNLAKLYIHSFSTKLTTLQQSKHPIFLLLKSHLIMFFLPVFKKFTDLVQQLTRYCHSGMIAFYQQNEQVLEKVLGQFIDEWPLELIEFLNILCKLVQGQPSTNGLLTTSSTGNYNSKLQSYQSSQSSTPSSKQQLQQKHISSMVPVKRFMIYSFLCDPELIKQHVLNQANNSNSGNSNSNNNNSNSNSNSNSNTHNNNNKTKSTTNPNPPKNPFSLQQYQQVCNYIINVFFTSSVKKYATYYTPQQLAPLIQLSTAIERKLQQRLASYSIQGRQFYYDQDSPSSLTDNYFIQQPILNYDYFILQHAINQIQFTPKDNKRYQMVSYVNVMAATNTNTNNLLQNNYNNNMMQQNFRLVKHSGRDNHHNYSNSNEMLMFAKDKQPSNQMFMKNGISNEVFIRGMKRELTLSPTNNNNRLMAHNEQLHHKFSFVQQKQSLNATLTLNQHQYSTMNKAYLTTPAFYPHGGDQQQFDLPNNNNHNQLDLLTWMTIGGNHNYKQKISARKIKLSKTLQPHSLQKNKTLNISPRTLNLDNIKLNKIDDNQNYYDQLYTHGRSNSYGGNQKENEVIVRREALHNTNTNTTRKRKLQFKSFNKDKVKQINRLYDEYTSKNVYV